MNTSPYNGQQVEFKGVGNLKHSGQVVGQSDNGQTLYIRSNNPNIPPAEYHFSIPLSVFTDLLGDDRKNE